MAKYTVVETSNMAAVRYAERIFDCVAEEDIENGTFGYLGEQETEGSHIYKFIKGAKDGEQIVIVNQPAWTEDTCRITNQRRDQFIIPAGTPFRVFVVKNNDEFGLTVEGFTPATRAEVKVGAFATIDATTGKMVAAPTLTDGAAKYGKIMRKRKMGAKIVTAAHEYGYENDMFEIKFVG